MFVAILVALLSKCKRARLLVSPPIHLTVKILRDLTNIHAAAQCLTRPMLFLTKFQSIITVIISINNLNGFFFDSKFKPFPPNSTTLIRFEFQESVIEYKLRPLQTNEA